MDDLDIRVDLEQAAANAADTADELARAVAAREPLDRLAALASTYLEQRRIVDRLRREHRMAVAG